MFGLLQKIFGGKKSAPYEGQKEQLTKGDPRALMALAAGADTNPEILYYLAKSEDADIRRAVAVNKATPVQASALLANDKSVDVRFALAARLMELLPDLSADKHSQLYAYAVQALGALAQDEVIKIRKALSTTLAEYAKAPPAVVSRLARDIEREISEPVLRFCVSLSDDDLFDILSSHPEPWVISTIAGRANVSERISDAVFETGDAPGTKVLVGNPGAHLSAETLQKIIDHARQYPEWHQPIALRSELSLDLARQLAGFVSEAVLSVLHKRSDFDSSTRQSIAGIVERRIEYQRQAAPNEPAEDKVARFVKAGGISPEVLQDALSWNEAEFVTLALAQMSRIHLVVVRKMLGTAAAKPVIALCWQAKLPMRLCVEIQRSLAKVPPREVLYAKGGTDYPLTPEDIQWQLEFFGIK